MNTPTVLASSGFDQQIVALAAGDQDLYYGTLSNSTAGQIRRIPIGGGDSTLLVSGVQVGELLLDADSLYYVATSNSLGPYTLWMLPIAGGMPQIIATDERLTQLHVDASSIYYQARSSTGAGRIARVAKASMDASTPETVVETQNPWGFAIDDASVYWARYDAAAGGMLFRRSLVGGTTTTIAKSTEPIVEPMVHGDYVYFFYGATPGVCRGAVMRVLKTGGVVEQVSFGNTGAASAVGAVPADDTYVYWGQFWYATDRILRVSQQPDDRGPEVVVDNQLNLGPFILTPTHLYWTARSSSSGPYEIRSVLK
jgi:hypothetical protein